MSVQLLQSANLFKCNFSLLSWATELVGVHITKCEI